MVRHDFSSDILTLLRGSNLYHRPLRQGLLYEFLPIKSARISLLLKTSLGIVSCTMLYSSYYNILHSYFAGLASATILHTSVLLVLSGMNVPLKAKYSMLFGTWLGQEQDCLGKSLEWLYRNPRFPKGHYRCLANLCYQVKLRYEASQVWLNATFYSTRSAIIGLAVETWRVKTELIIITILHIIMEPNARDTTVQWHTY